jgi:hypothetical protein
MQAVQSIGNVSKLIKIREKAKYEDVKKLCDDIITSTAKEFGAKDRIIAISGLSDQELLSEIAGSKDDLSIRIAAAKNISDTTKREIALTRIAADWKIEILGIDLKKNDIYREKLDALKERTTELVAEYMKKNPNGSDISGIIKREENKINEEVESQFTKEKNKLNIIGKELEDLLPQLKNENS